MKLLFDRRYPVTSILLLVTTAVFLSMFIRFGSDYQTGAAVYYSGGIIGEVVKVDPSQLWRPSITWDVWQKISLDRRLS